MRVCVCARGFGGSGGVNVINSHPSKKKKKGIHRLIKGGGDNSVPVGGRGYGKGTDDSEVVGTKGAGPCLLRDETAKVNYY